MFGGQVQTPGIIQNQKIDFSISGDVSIIAGVTGKKIYIFRLYFIVGASTSITFKNGTTALTGAMPFPTGGMVLDPTLAPWHECDTGAAFVMNSTNAVQVSGAIGYIQSKPIA